MAGYVPERGDIVWLRFTPQAGHEQAGRRPALVVSPRTYNRRSGLALFCPVTSVVKGYPFEVVLPPGIKASGAVLCDQIKSLDWRARKATKICPAPPEVLEETTAKILALVDPE
jgi:mRNA interferase MazF